MLHLTFSVAVVFASPRPCQAAVLYLSVASGVLMRTSKVLTALLTSGNTMWMELCSRRKWPHGLHPANGPPSIAASAQGSRCCTWQLVFVLGSGRSVCPEQHCAIKISVVTEVSQACATRHVTPAPALKVWQVHGRRWISDAI